MAKGFKGFHNVATAKWMKENEPNEYVITVAEKRLSDYKAKYVPDGVNKYTGELLIAAGCALGSLITVEPRDELAIRATQRVLEQLALTVETAIVKKELKD